MDDLISRQAAIDAFDGVKVDEENCTEYDIGYNDGIDFAVSRLSVLPSAQPERKWGRWNITDAYPHNVYCSECHTRFAQTHWAVWEDGSLPRNYCPNCGAEMEVEDGSG